MALRPEPSPEPPAKARFLAALALIPFLLTLTLAYTGIDFGFHWDEDYNKIKAVAYSLEHDFTLLPDGYTYPGVNYWLTLGTLSPEIVRTARQSGADAAAFRTALLPVVHSQGFLLRLRRVYAFIAALTAIWIYLAIFGWSGSAKEALLGSLLFASSWEVVYHARWVAPDPVLMQFGALTLLLLIVAWKKNAAWALTAAAVAAGLGCGTKYPGALLMLPVWSLPLLQASRHGGWGRAVLRCVALGAIFLAVYLVTTPGTVLQPIAFYDSLAASHKVYAEGWFGYTVTPGLIHLGKMACYFATAVFSVFRPAALLCFGLMVIGTWALVRENLRAALLVLVFPVIYTLYFSRQATMIVRNYLILVPFAVFLIVRGAAWVEQHLPGRGARLAGSGLLAVLLLVNGVDQFRAAASVARRRDTAGFVAEFAHYADEHPRRRILVSARLAAQLQQQGQWPKANLGTTTADPFDAYASFYEEAVMPVQLEWRTNRPGSFLAVFGARDVNLDYYTGWQASPRVIVLSPAMARETGALPR